MKFALKPSVSLSMRKDGTAIFREGNRKKGVQVELTEPRLREFIVNLRTGIDADSFQAYALDRHLGQMVNYLNNRGWLVSKSENPYREEPREKLYCYLEATKNSVEAKKTLEQLAGTRVLILGCGGTGGAVAQHLLAMGIKSFVLVDNDRVQASNLNRQTVFSRADIGRSKTAALAAYLGARDPDVAVQTKELRVHSSQDVADLIMEFQPDFLFCGADHPPLLCHRWVATACEASQLPCLFGGVGIWDGSWGPLLDTPSAFASYLSELGRIEETYDIDSFATVEGSLSTTNMLVSTLMAHDVFQYLIGADEPLSLGRKMRIDFPSLTLRSASIEGAT